jgi:protein SCO1
MRKRSSIWLFVILVFIIPFSAFALFNWYEKKVQSLPVLVNKVHRIQSFSLKDQDGKNNSLSDWDGKIVIADFFFTHCPTICPKMTEHMLMLQKAFSNDKEILLISFTVDPQNDSPGQLKNYCTQRNIDNSNWIFLTGEKKELYKLARNSFKIVATDGDGGPDDFIHSEKLVLIDKQKRIRGYYDGTSTKETEQLITDIKKLKYEN